MKALTLWQPWASLIAEGVKTIETRSWKAPDALIGTRIAIHAAKKDTDNTIGDPAFRQAWNALGDVIGGAAPVRGAIIATARLVGCAPMVSDYEEACGAYEGPAALELGESWTGIGWAVLYPEWGGALDDDELVNATDQLPYGDFAPGRWAWILDDVEKLPEPIPAKGGQRIWNWTVAS